jgi:hypothetical protein
MELKEYETLLIITVLALGGVYIRITIEEINVFKILKGTNIKLLFDSKITFNKLKKHRSYNLPTIIYYSDNDYDN